MPLSAKKVAASYSTGGARIPRAPLVSCLTCPLCSNLFRDATTISECLHTFCRDCIHRRLSDGETNNCPMCNVSLGTLPLEKLRADHQLDDVKVKIFADSSRKRKNGPGSSPAAISSGTPLRRRERSLYSLGIGAAAAQASSLANPGFATRTTRRSSGKSVAGRDSTSTSDDDDEIDDDDELLLEHDEHELNDEDVEADEMDGDEEDDDEEEEEEEKDDDLETEELTEEDDEGPEVPHQEVAGADGSSRAKKLSNHHHHHHAQHQHHPHHQQQQPRATSASFGGHVTPSAAAAADGTTTTTRIREPNSSNNVINGKTASLDSSRPPSLPLPPGHPSGASATAVSSHGALADGGVNTTLGRGSPPRARRSSPQQLQQKNNSSNNNNASGSSLKLFVNGAVERPAILKHPNSSGAAPPHLLSAAAGANGSHLAGATFGPGSCGIWFALQAARNQSDNPLPQLTSPYLRIKDGKLPVSHVKKYLVKKLGLNNETEVEITCRGQPVVSSLPLESVRNIWFATAVPDGNEQDEQGQAAAGNDSSTTALGRLDASSAKELIMVLTYQRHRRNARIC